MLKIAACDDNNKDISLISMFVNKFFIHKNIQYTYTPFSNPHELLEMQASEPFDIILLDIIMPEASGIQTARDIFECGKRTILAFFSSTPDFVFEGYGVNAVQYCLKPVTEEKINSLLESCYKRYLELDASSIILKEKSTSRKVRIQDIIYLESNDKAVRFICDGFSMTCTGRLDLFLEELPSYFIFTHKSFAVNLNRMQAFRDTEIISDVGHAIPVSRRMQKTVKQKYIDHVMEEV